MYTLKEFIKSDEKMKKTNIKEEYKKGFANRLVEAMKNKGYYSKRNGMSSVDASALRDALKTSYAMAHRYVNGHAQPRKDVIEALAKWLDVQPGWLEYGLETVSASNPVPILKWDSKIFLDKQAWEKAYDNATDFVKLHVPVKPEYFALQLEDNAWSPMFKKGTKIVFDRSQKPESDDLALILEPGRSPTFGILIKRVDQFYIRGLEENIAPRELDPKTQLIGKFIAADFVISE